MPKNKKSKTGTFTITVFYKGELNPLKDAVLKKALGRGRISSGMFLGTPKHPRARDITRTFRLRVACQEALKRLKKVKGFRFRTEVLW